MAGGKGKSSGGKSSGGKTSANDGPKKQQSHSARAGLQVSSFGFFGLFFFFLSLLGTLRSDAPMTGHPSTGRRLVGKTPRSTTRLYRYRRLASGPAGCSDLCSRWLVGWLIAAPPTPPLTRRNGHRIGPAQRVPVYHPAFAIARRRGHCRGCRLGMPGLRRENSRQQTVLISRCTC
jgi:hypothetical protein